MKSLVLPDEVYSPDQLSTAVFELNDYQNALRDQVARARSKTKSNIDAPEPSALLQAILNAIDAKNIDPNGLDDLRSALEEILKKSCTAHLILAAMPSMVIKKKLTNWFRQEISPNMLITFSVRSDIGGGAILRTGSRIYDFSFRNLLIANKSKLAEIANRV